MNECQGTVLVVVLGNISQSPRMKNHIDQLYSHGFRVQVLAYQGDYPHYLIC